MFPDFLPQQVNLLKNSDSVFIAKKIERYPVSTSLSSQAIATAYVKLGTAFPTILLLHGFDSSLLEFRHLIPLLVTKYQTWAVDLLGFGFTARLPNLSYNPDTIREHFYSFWRSLINRPVILIGASMGGATAIDFTQAHPEAVQKLILINSVGYSGSFPIGRLLFEPIAGLAVEYWRQRRIQSLCWGKNLGLLDSRTEDAICCAALPSFMPEWQRAISDFTRSGGYDRLSQRIPFIDKPTLLLWGEQDDVVGTEVAYKFEKTIVGSKLVWLPKVGHVPQWEHPELLATHILEWLDG
ncbi:alpha/beta fold hydrolase [Myxosarcina sp. GI1]|uniref:alpha/beta fold hydrolase n=1 Tax=Myxosarcina sp. GI1 TaxID=1541065 RepID=UPI0005657067|nr:alpha/beta hydrolase [Myxosarcina sp. GI1]